MDMRYLLARLRAETDKSFIIKVLEDLVVILQKRLVSQRSFIYPMII